MKLERGVFREKIGGGRPQKSEHRFLKEKRPRGGAAFL